MAENPTFTLATRTGDLNIGINYQGVFNKEMAWQSEEFLNFARVYDLSSGDISVTSSGNLPTRSFVPSGKTWAISETPAPDYLVKPVASKITEITLFDQQIWQKMSGKYYRVHGDQFTSLLNDVLFQALREVAKGQLALPKVLDCDFIRDFLIFSRSKHDLNDYNFISHRTPSSRFLKSEPTIVYQTPVA
ncbi:MAG: hypothetical protein Q7S88_02720 [Candidatus Daviesbacteria bacterium]|nr:hypothetical protein [Candidatus Daviesbacteria bacterium]